MKPQLIMEELITKYFCYILTYWNILIIDYLMIILILINMKKKKNFHLHVNWYPPTL